METTNRYSDKDLEEFKALIHQRLKRHNMIWNLVSAYMNDLNNGTEDTSPTFKAFDEDIRL